VYGVPGRYTLGSNSVLSIDTRYAQSGQEEIEVVVGNTNALVFDPQNPAFDVKTTYVTVTALPLDFENPTYLVFASNNCSPDVGTNYIMFAVSKAQQIQATIADPSSGQTVASYGGYVPYPTTVVIPWNFTTLNGAPYTNDTYSVTFVAYDPETLTFTNRIERYSVRPAAGNILTYEEEDPALSAGPYLNSEAKKWIGSLAVAYMDLYDNDPTPWTSYSTADIGPNRDNPASYPFPFVLTGTSQTTWPFQVCFALTNTAFSDFAFYMGHGNGTDIGGHASGSHFVNAYMESSTIYTWARAYTNPSHWRLRKAVVWSCYSYATADLTGDGTYKSWPVALGIRPTEQQTGSLGTKNVGLFFTGELPQGDYSGTYGGTVAEVAALFDDIWITGPDPFPGGQDPTYAFSWAVDQIESMCPQMMKALPVWVGFGYLPYTGIYDADLVTNNVSNINR
jgi:hypothetical protein